MLPAAGIPRAEERGVRGAGTAGLRAGSAGGTGDGGNAQAPCGAGDPLSLSTCERCCCRRGSAKLLTFQSLFLARRLNIISYIST